LYFISAEWICMVCSSRRSMFWTRASFIWSTTFFGIVVSKLRRPGSRWYLIIVIIVIILLYSVILIIQFYCCNCDYCILLYYFDYRAYWNYWCYCSYCMMLTGSRWSGSSWPYFGQ
jgi:hypothetical protein